MQRFSSYSTYDKAEAIDASRHAHINCNVEALELSYQPPKRRLVFALRVHHLLHFFFLTLRGHHLYPDVGMHLEICRAATEP
jgi:hypothetical protein